MTMQANPWEQLAAVSLSAGSGRPTGDYYKAWDAGRATFDLVVRPAIPAHIRRAARADGVCVYCGAAEAGDLDHVQPWSRGGTHDVENLVPACEACNGSKSDRLLTEWDVVRVRRAVAASPKVAAAYAALVEAAPPQ